MESDTRAAWEGRLGSLAGPRGLTPSQDLPASAEGGDREGGKSGEKDLGRLWLQRRLFLVFATAACVSLTD